MACLMLVARKIFHWLDSVDSSPTEGRTASRRGLVPPPPAQSLNLYSARSQRTAEINLSLYVST
jgi:hypothetical protein